MNQSSRSSRWAQLTHTSMEMLRREGLAAFLRRAYLWLRGERRYYHPDKLSDNHRLRSILLHCDAPPHLLNNAVVYGTITVRGWALAPEGVETVKIYLDSALLGEARKGEVRADIGMFYHHINGADRSGFSFKWDTTLVPDGEYELRLLATSRTGQKQTLTGKVVINNTIPPKSEYDLWIETYEQPDILEAKAQSNELPYQPYLSVVIPVFNTDADLLKQAIASVTSQTYRHWELCLGDDGSTQPHVRQILEQLCQKDDRIKVTYLAQNSGISAATNAALELAGGDFVVLMDHDDELAPHALYFVAKWLNQHPAADLIYSDEDKIGLEGRRFDPFFKPDWSPDLFLSMNYLNHLTAVRVELLKAVGGFRSEFDGSQDYDLYLRLSERTDKIVHIPKILYHWRTAPTSVAYNVQSKSFTGTAAQKALTKHLQRKGLQAEVVAGNVSGRWRIKYIIAKPSRLAIIIPCHTNVEGLKSLTDQIIEQQPACSIEFIIIDNSTGHEVHLVTQQLAKKSPATQYLDWRRQPFNFSRMNNAAVRLTEAPLLLFLNDDVEPINPDWLEAMLEHLQRPEVGAVGAKLIFPDHTIQHAGVVMGLYNNCGHAFKAMPAAAQETVYFDLPHVIRNCSAVTGACLLTRQEIFWKVGGFNEIHLAAAFQDIDLCLKIGQQGYRIIYTPHAQLFHHESKTKIKTDREVMPHPYEVWYMQQTWATVIAQDPYYNPNLTRYDETYNLRPASRRYIW